MQYRDLSKEAERYEELLRTKQKTQKEGKTSPDSDWEHYTDLFQEAEHYEQELANDNSSTGQAWQQYQIGRFFANSNDYQQSIAYFNKAIDMLPNEKIFLCSHCEALEKLAQFDEVLLDCDKILRICLEEFEARSDDKTTFKQIADVISKVAKYRQCNPVLIMNLDEGKNWLNLGSLLRQAKQLDLAAKIFEQGLYFFPNNRSLLANDLELALLQRDQKRAIKRFKTAKALLKPDHETYALIPFLVWLAWPNSDWQIVKKAIQKLEKHTQFSWKAHDDIKEHISKRLNPRQRHVADAYMGFFEKKRTSTLKQQSIR